MKKLLLAVTLISIQFVHAQQLQPQQLTNLNLTGQFWTFLKYHHPAVATGRYDWDSVLIQMIPAVTAAKNNDALSKVLEQCLDKFPVPSRCKKCAEIDAWDFDIKPDYGNLLDGSVLSPALTKKLQYIRDNRNLDSNYYVKMSPIKNPEFQHEKPYREMTYPTLPYRLIALYRYWGAANYFFPSRHMTDMKWNKVLSHMLPYFVNAKTDQEYSAALLRLVSCLDDTHSMILGMATALGEYRGLYTTPFNAQFIEGKLVITDIHTDTLDVKKKLAVGDIITSINDRPVADLVKQYLPLIPASNMDTKLRDLPYGFLLRSHTLLQYKVTIDRKGTVFTYQPPMGDRSWMNRSSKAAGEKAYKLINDSIGYVFSGKYKNEMLPDIIKTFSKAKGIIVDMRCYPGDFMPFTFGEYIKKDNTEFARFVCGTIDYPGAFGATKIRMTNGGKYGAATFKGKVVVIVNASTQSQAEYTTMAFQSASNVQVIGSTTAGADGDVSTIIFPGSMGTWISGLGVLYPDNTPAQRKGVKIDHKIYPTIKGIREGRDELMEKAIQLLNTL